LTDAAEALVDTARSESWKITTSIESDIELFAGFGSGVVEDTSTVLTIVAGVGGVRSTRSALRPVSGSRVVS
jgi:hypothetical protein